MTAASQPPDRDVAAAQVSVTLIGGPTALIDYGGLRILTDPTFDPPGEYPRPGTPVVLEKLRGPAIAAGDVGLVDLVLASHDHHSDNLDTSGRELALAAPLILTTGAGAARLGPPARGLAPGESVEVAGGVRVTAVEAHHGPPEIAIRNGPVVGFVLGGPGRPRLYVSGDNASVPLVGQIVADHGPFAAAVLFAGGAQVPAAYGPDQLLTLDGAGAARAAELLGDAVIVPIHQEGWAHFSSPPQDLAAAFAAAGLGERLRPVTPGETVRL